MLASRSADAEAGVVQRAAVKGIALSRLLPCPAPVPMLRLELWPFTHCALLAYGCHGGHAGRWVEIMASSRTGSDGGSFCVSDWGPEGEEQACTKEGDLYECREAGRSQVRCASLWTLIGL